MTYLFGSLAMQSVGKAAGAVVEAIITPRLEAVPAVLERP